ncbi:MAG: hypothetical protein ACL93V_05470 [Candidatus Electrothrix sp. YB6]
MLRKYMVSNMGKDPFFLLAAAAGAVAVFYFLPKVLAARGVGCLP